MSSAVMHIFSPQAAKSVCFSLHVMVFPCTCCNSRDFYTSVWNIQGSLEVEDLHGRRAVHHAAQAGANSALSLLQREGASIEAEIVSTGQTPLHCAARVRKCAHSAIAPSTEPPAFNEL